MALDFDSRVLILGFGAVAEAALPLLLRHLRVPCDRITVLDFADRTQALSPWVAKGLRFVRERVLPHNLSSLLATHVDRGGLVIDLTWSIDFFSILDWVREADVFYANASLESWDPSHELECQSLFDKSLYRHYARILELKPQWAGRRTAVVDQGSNPGLISSFLKQGLVDIAGRLVRDNDLPEEHRRQLERHLSESDFPHLARSLGVKAIHCSELDTQQGTRIKQPDEFVGTWSVEGMWEESIAPSEFGWGTHEKQLPEHGRRLHRSPESQLILPRMGMNTWVRSWVPRQEIVGMLVTHGETFTIAHALTVRENGRVAYRPTVLYAYLPCRDTMVSMHELRCRRYELHPKTRILNDETCTGSDIMGALIMGHRYRSWWTGTMLAAPQAREMLGHVNATAVQVASGLIAGVLWAIQNPQRGLCLPEDLPHDEVLTFARPYLGEFLSEPVDWTPLMRYREYIAGDPRPGPDLEDPWQFRNFAFRP